ncbi:MAG: hypothetical protein JSU07_08915 [Bacteroidetes bacterium]|nr:hypothetical protein [Bacteroidota bacterium]
MKNLLNTLILNLLFLNAAAQYTKLFDFSSTDGYNPLGSLISDGTYLYGMTAIGGANNAGVIFKIKTDGTGYTRLHDFSSIANDGKYPHGSLYYDGTSYLYGMTNSGGTYSLGVIFKIMINGTGYTKLHEFGSIANDGNSPEGSLYYDGAYLYGTTFSGGTNNAGTLFKLMSDGSNYSKVYEFNSSVSAYYPLASLITDGTFLYGTASTAGVTGPYQYGAVFKILPSGSSYSVIAAFTNTNNGLSPGGTLTYDGTYLYGTTSQYGFGGLGTLFKVKPDGSNFTKLFDFYNMLPGSGCNEVMLNGNYLYGLTQSGGSGGVGALFTIKTDGSGIKNSYNFMLGVSGCQPIGTLISDGVNFYGLCQAGGINNKGVIFKINSLTLGIEYVNNNLTQFNIYPSPADEFLNISCLSYELSALSGVIDNPKFEILNMLGQVVYQSTVSNVALRAVEGHLLTISTKELPNGLYTIVLQNAKQKFIIQH